MPVSRVALGGIPAFAGVRGDLRRMWEGVYRPIAVVQVASIVKICPLLLTFVDLLIAIYRRLALFVPAVDPF
jgi:hypothetical protein